MNSVNESLCFGSSGVMYMDNRNEMSHCHFSQVDLCMFFTTYPYFFFHLLLLNVYCSKVGQ